MSSRCTETESDQTLKLPFSCVIVGQQVWKKKTYCVKHVLENWMRRMEKRTVFYGFIRLIHLYTLN